MKRLLTTVALAMTIASPVFADTDPGSALKFFQQPVETVSVKQRTRGTVSNEISRISRPLDITPPPFVRGRLVCAKNVGRLLNKIGKSSSGSNKALSYVSWGRPSARVPGAVIVQTRSGRGNGHVMVVATNDNQCWNPSSSAQNWRLVPCPSNRVIAVRA